jgi:signal transduction histidine kinase
VDVEGDKLIAEVMDDGIGGAAATPTSGLGGLTDRLEALGGTLTLDSPAGDGTLIRACVAARPRASTEQ